MVFSLSFGGVQVRLIPAFTNDNNAKNNNSFSIQGVRHCDDGHIEAEVSNFSGTIIISSEVQESSSSSSSDANDNETELHNNINSRELLQVVDGIPEPPEKLNTGAATSSSSSQIATTAILHEKIDSQSSFLTANSHDTVNIDNTDDDEEKNKIQIMTNAPQSSSGSGVQFDISNIQIINNNNEEPDNDELIDLTLHKLCASDEVDISDIRYLLQTHPELASVRDKFGDYPAHIFANNDSFIYTSSDYEVEQFAYELYKACPTAFLSEGYDDQLPFVGTIVDWVDDCHQTYTRDSKHMVVRLSEIKTLTKSTRVINSLCVREEVQKLLQLPENVHLPAKVLYSFKMLSKILDTLSESAFEDISIRREFWAMASKRRDKIITSMASVPFLVRTILLIEQHTDRDALIELSIVKNLMFRPQSVDLWLVALLSGGERARACATHYLCLISRSSLSGLVGRKMNWGESDRLRFHSMREDLYRSVGKLNGFLPCMLHLGDSLYEVSTRRAVKYAVENTIGRPLPVYLQFYESFMLLILMTTYRIIVEMVYALPSEEFLSQNRSLWGLGLSISVYFIMRDLIILASFASTEEKLALRYLSGYSNLIGMITMISVIAVLSMLHVNGNIEGHNYIGIVGGLLWWKFLLHIKGMSEALSTLIYTIVEIGLKLRYFITIFLISIFFFADMIDIVKKTSGDCDYVDGEADNDLETFCSLTPLQSYLAMYGVMIGGMEIQSLDSTSAVVSLLLVAASFCGVIVLVNILIAIVTSEYEKATQRSCSLFARSRLEAAARYAAREKFVNPPNDPNMPRFLRLWRWSGGVKYLSINVLVEYFLITSLISSAALYREGILDLFLYVALIICAILYHLFVVAANMYLFARSICRLEQLRWLRGSRFHKGMLKICLAPVCRYITSVGLGKGERCPDASDVVENDRPATHKQQIETESQIQDAIKASETRILNAVSQMMMFQPPKYDTEEETLGSSDDLKPSRTY